MLPIIKNIQRNLQNILGTTIVLGTTTKLLDYMITDNEKNNKRLNDLKDNIQKDININNTAK